jgi:hypothetical protein
MIVEIMIANRIERNNKEKIFVKMVDGFLKYCEDL